MASQKPGLGAVILVITVGALVIWGPQIMHTLDLGTPKAGKLLVGEWHGTFSIGGVYKTDLYDETAGPHQGGTAYVHFFRPSPNIDWVEGKGEICLAGEASARPLTVTVHSYGDDGSFPIVFHSDPPLGALPWTARIAHTQNAPDTLTFGNDIELSIHGTMHRGSESEYRKQSTCAPPPEKD
jgi:hypothetical protein